MAKPKGFKKYVTEEKEGRNVYAYVVHQDTKGDRYVLNKDKSAFIPAEVRNEKGEMVSNLHNAHSVHVGHSTSYKGLTPAHRNQIFSSVPAQVGHIDKYEHDVDVMDEFQLGAGSAVHHTQNLDVED